MTTLLDINNKLNELKIRLTKQEYAELEQQIFSETATHLGKTPPELLAFITLHSGGEELIAKLEDEINDCDKATIGRLNRFSGTLIGLLLILLPLDQFAVIRLFTNENFASERSTLCFFIMIIIGVIILIATWAPTLIKKLKTR